MLVAILIISFIIVCMLCGSTADSRAADDAITQGYRLRQRNGTHRDCPHQRAWEKRNPPL